MPCKMLKGEQFRKYLLLKVYDPDSALTQTREEAVGLEVDIRRRQVGHDSSFHLGAVWPLLSLPGGVIPPEVTDR